ncbi:MAG: hypothetical protein NVS1B13_21970 [Flavisolibacter sp.]
MVLVGVQVIKHNSMKKIMIALVLMGSLGFINQAKAQKVTYYYYPDANVYYNPQTHEYAYADNENWRYDKELPSTYKLNKRYVTIYGNSDRDEIWRDNQMHREKYTKKDLKRDFKREKKEAKLEIKKEKRKEKRELKRDDKQQ